MVAVGTYDLMHTTQTPHHYTDSSGFNKYDTLENEHKHMSTKRQKTQI